ncbi:LysR family transcriptional regulator, glycine cleavage system transcriptional activator [Shimia gijangensis]|uniref:LysR family transcriptional regulator, glycine cleavage system transcriptional activator n=1 Tax=Shimia gijangensis TaxID=1470563 RepID=A0A1M6CIM1_9RHOB|nr:LysR family transcriptional regulator [Shimia gijangensis]SHI60885.1 LysR family transcriptional regulator, glycine cleavage system transcriptional activator [Shimia gijangensis]
MSKLPSLVWLRSFECAARHLSFTAAAGELGITQNALSLHVRSLEAKLGCKLFTRAARKLALTEVGQAYAFSLRRALGDIALSTSSLFGAGSAQVLTVRAPISTATLWLSRRLPEFVERHPGITIKLVSNIWAESIGHEDVDVELRLGTGGWDDFVSRKISSEKIVPIAATSIGSQQAVIDVLKQGPMVQILGYEDMSQLYLSAHDVILSEQTSPFSVDTTIAAIEIVAAGGGYAVVLERFANYAVEFGHPITIVGEPIPFNQSHYLIVGSAPEVNDTSKQLFEAWVEEIFQ